MSCVGRGRRFAEQRRLRLRRAPVDRFGRESLRERIERGDAPCVEIVVDDDDVHQISESCTGPVASARRRFSDGDSASGGR